MKEISIIKYKCDKCGHAYSDEKEALECESKEISQDKGVKIGDIVLITNGGGAGKKAKVKEIIIFDKNWGHYAWKVYWHTVGITADILGEYGARLLTFDSYEVVK